MLYRRTKTDGQTWFVPQNWDWIRPLRRRIALKVLVFAAIPIVCLGIFDIMQMRGRAVATAEERLYQTANYARKEVLEQLARWTETTRELGADPYLSRDVVQWMEGREGAATAEARVQRQMENVVRHAGFARSWFAAPDGRVLLTGETSGKGKTAVVGADGTMTANLAGEDFFRTAVGKPSLMVHDLRYSETRRENELVFSTPIWHSSTAGDSQPRLLGYWFNVVRPEEKLFAALGRGPGATGETYLYRDEKGNNRHLYLSPTLSRPHAALRLVVPAALAQRPPPQRPGIGEKSSFVARDYDGKTVLAQPLAVVLGDGNGNVLLRWVLVTQQEFEEAIGFDLRDREWRSILLMAISFIGIGILAYSIEKRLTAQRLSVAYHYANSLINSESSIVYAVDKNHSIQHVNRPLEAFTRQNGGASLATDGVIGKNIVDVVGTEKLKPLFCAVLDDIIAGRRISFARETAFGPPEDPSYWFTTISPLVLDGRIEGAVVTLSDMTDRVKMENEAERRSRQLRSLYDINRAISEVADVDVILSLVAEGARSAIGAAAAFMTRHDADEDVLLGALATDPAFAGFRSVRLKSTEPSLHSLALNQKKTVVSENVADDARSQKSLAQTMRAKSAVVVPLIYQNTVLGTMAVYETQQTRKFTDEEVKLLEEIGRQAAIAMHGAALLNSYKQTSERLGYLTDNVQEIIFQVDKDGRTIFLNRTFEAVFGYPVPEWLNRAFETLVVPDDLPGLRQKMAQALGGEKVSAETQFRTARETRQFALTLSPLRDPAGNTIGVQGLARDITEQRKIQEQLLQAQKMDSLGALAGGVAHDFNNLLTAVSGYNSMMLAQCPPDHPWQQPLKTMSTSVDRMAALTRQLLTFSRKTVGVMEPTDLNKVADEVRLILKRTVDQRIRFAANLAPNLPLVVADPSQLNQVLMNLCINARDAMPDGGLITIETSEVVLTDETAHSHPPLKPGRHVRLTVADTGKGIPPEIQRRIFEPFFTTKQLGKGTGLGLSVVYGIVSVHKGRISFTSEPGKGTMFEILMPVTEQRKEQAVPVAEPAGDAAGETVLVVDDEEMLLELSRSVLESFGYNVLTTTNPVEALEIYRKRHKEISLVVSDIMMPQMTARELFPQLKEINPRVKVVLSSGYSADSTAQSILNMGAVGFLQKPYRINEMASLVRSAIEKN